MKKKITPSTLASEPVSNPTIMSSDARGSIKVMKTSYFTPPVTGAGYGVYTDRACTKAVDDLWIGLEGQNYDISPNLPLGTYYVKEFYAPEGYELDEEVYMVKLTQNGQMAVVNSVEPTTEPHGNIKVAKSTYFNDPVVGTGFGIYNNKDCALEHNVDTLWMGLDGGNADTSVDLPFGTYYVKEYYTLDGNVPDEDIYSVTLTKDGETVVVNSVGPTAKPHGNIKVCKASYFNDPVVGTGFGIYNNKDCALEHNVDTLWIGLKGDDSDISIDLPLGTYYVKEYYTLADNYADDEIHTVTLANDGDMVTVTSIAPTKKDHGNVKVVKKSNLSVPVTGAGYGIYRDKACTQSMDALWIGLVDDDSDISCDLPAGTYYVKEFSAPDGYDLDPTVHTVTVKNGQTATVTSNEPLNASTAVLLKPDGSYYTHLKINDEFPSVACEEYNVLGWSKTKHDVFTPDSIKSSGKNIVQTVGDYNVEGDDIKSGGAYYMVAFKERTDSYTTKVSAPKDNTVVYFVGDSRTVHVYDFLARGGAFTIDGQDTDRPLDDKLEFVKMSGEGIVWFQNTGLAELKTKLKAHKGKNNVIIFNWGVNDAASAANSAKYSSFFQSTASQLKNIDSNCKLYFANVYPVSAATLDAHDGRHGVEIKHIKKMNTIIDGICKNGSYTKINLYDYLRQYGLFWAKNENTIDHKEKRYDGIHPSPTSALRIYEYCLEQAECKSTNTVDVTLATN